MNRIIVAGVAFFGGLGAGAWICSPAARAFEGPRVIEAQRFVLKDADGTRLGEMRVSPDGRPVLEFFNRSGGVIWTAPGVKPLPVRSR